MSRSTIGIKPECWKRLTIILANEDITQSELAGRIHVSPQTISKIMNGKCQLTRAIARLIVGAFPKYRIEWLLGFDDFPTKKDQTNALQCQRCRKMYASKDHLKEVLVLRRTENHAAFLCADCQAVILREIENPGEVIEK